MIENHKFVNKDAFSNGQIGSKIWLCEELEKLGWESDFTYVYGGWYGITAFLLLSRGNFKVNRIRSIDMDPACQEIADMINENWLIQEWKFKAFTNDCNNFEPVYGDLVINTSTEHFESMEWFNRIPAGTRVILQGNDMPHDDHVVHSKTLSDFIDHYPLSNCVYAGEKEFAYPEWKFTRFMIIGIK
jgi:hypothetical protein